MKFDGILSVFHHNSALLHSLVLVASYLTLTFGNLCGVKQIASEAAHEMDTNLIAQLQSSARFSSNLGF